MSVIEQPKELCYENHGSKGSQVVAYFYLIACALCFLATYVALDRLEAQQLQGIRRGMFFYSSQDVKSTETAEWLHSHYGVRTLDLLVPHAGSEVFRLTGAHSATSPSLLIPVRGGVQLFSTPSAV